MAWSTGCLVRLPLPKALEKHQVFGTAVVTSNACLTQLFMVKQVSEIKKKTKKNPNIIRNSSKVFNFLILKSLPHLKEKHFVVKKN